MKIPQKISVKITNQASSKAGTHSNQYKLVIIAVTASGHIKNNFIRPNKR